MAVTSKVSIDDKKDNSINVIKKWDIGQKLLPASIMSMIVGFVYIIASVITLALLG
jgi:hypothetical protein